MTNVLIMSIIFGAVVVVIISLIYFKLNKKN